LKYFFCLKTELLAHVLANCTVLVIIKPSTCNGDRSLIEYIACNVNVVTRVFVNERYAYALSILATDLIKACLSLLFAVAVRKADAQIDCFYINSELIYNTSFLKLNILKYRYTHTQTHTHTQIF